MKKKKSAGAAVECIGYTVLHSRHVQFFVKMEKGGPKRWGQCSDRPALSVENYAGVERSALLLALDDNLPSILRILTIRDIFISIECDILIHLCSFTFPTSQQQFGAMHVSDNAVQDVPNAVTRVTLLC